MVVEKISKDAHRIKIGSREYLLLRVKDGEVRRLQDRVRKFAEEREWINRLDDPRDYLLGIVEEVGEFRNVIKWIEDRKTVNKLLKENFDVVEDLLGDVLWFVFMLANRCGVDVKKAIERVIENNTKRFPVELVKGKHTNIYAGGVDLKYKKEKTS